jgi:oxygen-independent coproporphyrinogen III oxidase
LAGVYISYPFCAQKCTYCNFASGVFSRNEEQQYVQALLRELRGHHWEWQPETLYLGGGTPSNLATHNLREILALIPGEPWREATMEAAPGTVTAERAGAWAACGINRVSLGVQSFVEAEIRRTGRKHTAETVQREVAAMRSAGISNVNLDLIAGLPGQKLPSWHESLEWVERLTPFHVSVYMLEVDEESRLGKELLLGGVKYGAADVPSDEEIAELYETAVERLAAMGLRRYEISNFARPGFESIHNLKYWRLERYAGFGADAHSFDGRQRRQNPESLRDYLASKPAESTPAHVDQERFFVGLRLLEGIRPRSDEWQRFQSPIQRFLDAGLLETEAGVLRLTDRGVLFSNEVFQEFVSG